MTLRFALLAAMALSATALPALAQDRNVSRVSFSAGYYDALDDDDKAADLRVEYRFAEGLWGGMVKPFIGLEGTTDGAIYGLGGFYADLYLTDKIFVTPSLGAGLYSDGDGKDLGHVVEFRSQLEIGYEYNDLSRLTAGISHISNASLGDRNPGVEILSVYYHVPVNW